MAASCVPEPRSDVAAHRPSSSRTQACPRSPDRSASLPKSMLSLQLCPLMISQPHRNRLKLIRRLSKLTRRLWLVRTYKPPPTSSPDPSSSKASRVHCSTSTSHRRSGTSSAKPKTHTDLASRRLFSLAAKTLTQESEFMREVLNHTIPLPLFSTRSSKNTTSMTFLGDT